jgi:hypothetical protein
MIKMAVETGIDLGLTVANMFLPKIDWSDKVTELHKELVKLGIGTIGGVAGSLINSIPGSGSGSGASTPGPGTPGSGLEYLTPGIPGSGAGTPGSPSFPPTPKIPGAWPVTPPDSPSPRPNPSIPKSPGGDKTPHPPGAWPVTPPGTPPREDPVDLKPPIPGNGPSTPPLFGEGSKTDDIDKITTIWKPDTPVRPSTPINVEPPISLDNQKLPIPIGGPGNGGKKDTGDSLGAIPNPSQGPSKPKEEGSRDYLGGWPWKTEIYELEPIYRHRGSRPSKREEPVEVVSMNETFGVLQKRGGEPSPGLKLFMDNLVGLTTAVGRFARSNIVNGVEQSKYLKDAIEGDFGTGIDGMGNNQEAGGWCAAHGAGIWDQNQERHTALTSFINFEGKVIHDALFMIMDYVSAGNSPGLTFSSIMNGNARGWLKGHSNRIEDLE